MFVGFRYLQELVAEVASSDDDVFGQVFVDEVEEVAPAAAAVDAVLQNRQVHAAARVEDLLHELRPEVEVNDVLIPVLKRPHKQKLGERESRPAGPSAFMVLQIGVGESKREQERVCVCVCGKAYVPPREVELLEEDGLAADAELLHALSDHVHSLHG